VVWFQEQDALFAPLVELVAPDLHRFPGSYELALQRAKQESAWVTIKHRCDIRRAIAGHVAAGVTRESQSWCDSRPNDLIHAVGLRHAHNSHARILELDLDGGVEPAAVVAALSRVVGDGLQVTSSSLRGLREGRYRARVHIRPVLISQLHRVGKLLVESLGFRVQDGEVEICPATKNNRLPWGLGGCDLFDAQLRPLGHRHPLALARDLASHAPIDLGALVGSLERPRVLVSAPAPAQQRQPAPRPTPAEQEGRSARAKYYWSNGAQQGERDDALTELVFDCFRCRLPRATAVTKIQDWIRDGGLIRTRGAQSQRGYEHELRDVRRRVDKVYSTYRNAPPAPAWLTAGEIDLVVDLVDARTCSNPSPACMLGFLCRILPVFKGSVLAGLNYVRLPSKAWKNAGGNDYPKLREASGLFVLADNYLSPATAVRLEDAHCAGWRTTFTFDPSAPNRSLIPMRGRNVTDIAMGARMVAFRYRQCADNNAESLAKLPTCGTHKTPPQGSALPLCPPHFPLPVSMEGEFDDAAEVPCA